MRLIRNALSDFKNPAREFLGKKAHLFSHVVTDYLKKHEENESIQKLVLISILKLFTRTKPVCRAVLKTEYEKTQVFQSYFVKILNFLKFSKKVGKMSSNNSQNLENVLNFHKNNYQKL